MNQRYLPGELFQSIVEHTPLVSMDLIVRDAEDRILIGLRRNKPAQGYWFVPGGRIYKDETLNAAFQRITQSELGVGLALQKAKALGVFEHFYRDNFSGTPNVGTHYVVLAYELIIRHEMLKLPNDQHDDYRWLGDGELMADATVHEYTKSYARIG